MHRILFCLFVDAAYEWPALLVLTVVVLPFSLSSTKKKKDHQDQQYQPESLHMTMEPVISAQPQTTTPLPNKPEPYSTPSPKVKFGDSMAAEFISEEPTVSLTPMPAEVSRLRFPIDEVAQTKEQINETEETKSNTSILQEWDDDFDEYLKDDGSDLETQLFVSEPSPRRRRESAIFTPPPGRKALLEAPPDLTMMARLHADLPQLETTKHLDSGLELCSEVRAQRTMGHCFGINPA
jgi:hypothetical protein